MFQKSIIIRYLLLLSIVFSYSFSLKAQISNSTPPLDSAKYSEAQLVQGEVLKSNGRIQEAFQLYEALAELQRGNHKAYYQMALLAIEVRDLAFAYSALEQALEHEQDEYLYWDLWLQLHQHSGDAETSLDALAELIRLQPEEIKYYFDKAFALYYIGEEEQALAFHDLIEDKFGPSEPLIAARVELYRDLGDFERAINELLSFVETMPESRVAYVLLGELYTRNKQYNKALEILGKYEVTNPQDPIIQLGKADVYNMQGKKKPAFEALYKAFVSPELDFNRKTGLLYTAAQSVDRGQLDELVAVFVAAHPELPETYAIKGDILAQTGRYDQSKTAYRQALAINSQMPLVWNQLIQVDAQIGDLQDAQETGRKATALFPNNMELLMTAGSVYLMDGKNEEARQYFETALNNAEQTDSTMMTQIYGVLGDTYFALEMIAASDVAYQEALAMDADNVHVLNNYAYYLSERGERLEHAAEMAAKAVQLAPNDATLEDTYAWVLFKQGDYENALVWIERALTNVASTSAVLVEHYGDILFKNNQARQALRQWKKAQTMIDTSNERWSVLERKINEKALVD